MNSMLIALLILAVTIALFIWEPIPIVVTAIGASIPVSYTHLDVYKRQYAPRHRILGSNAAFDCALGGPFGNLHFGPVLSIPDSLCAHNYFDLRFIGLS